MNAPKKNRLNGFFSSHTFRTRLKPGVNEKISTQQLPSLPVSAASSRKLVENWRQDAAITGNQDVCRHLFRPPGVRLPDRKNNSGQWQQNLKNCHRPSPGNTPDQL